MCLTMNRKKMGMTEDGGVFSSDIPVLDLHRSQPPNFTKDCFNLINSIITNYTTPSKAIQGNFISLQKYDQF